MKNDPAFVREFLEEKVWEYNRPEFIASDPIQIPHRFSKKEDIELAAFLTAILSWGQRRIIITKAGQLMQMMDNSPHDFLKNSGDADWKHLECFCHRTFNGTDGVYFMHSLQHILFRHGSLRAFFETGYLTTFNIKETLQHFRKTFFETPCISRTQKHISDVSRGSSAKRLNMYLRWMIRNDNRGVDFGIWKTIPPSILSCPLDIHSGNLARKLGLLKRKQNDSKAVIELDAYLRSLDKLDPVKYDFALFGLGVFEKF
jgi:uncharacterized protein (TIGR02757 family)